MPSEVEQNVSKVADETKENSTIDTKENASEEPRSENGVLANDEPEELKVSDNENKENEKPITEDLDIESQKKHAEKLLTDGRRYVIIKDFQAAADVFSEVCNLFGNIYGEMAEECAEVYFMYGCALLELGKDQMSPVGLEEKVDDENEDVSVQEDLTDKKDAICDEKKTTLSSEEVEVTDIEKKKSVDDEKTSDEDDKTPDEDEEKSTQKENLLSEDEVSADEEEKPDEEDIGEDDVNDLQLAWEMLDLAKVIYKKMNTEESKLKLAEVLIKCGEVSIEDEQFETAIEDITESLEIRRLLLPEDSRIIAETLFQLGIAHELGGSGEKAIELLTEAAAVLGQRIKTLENTSNNLDTVKEEVAEIKTIIPEISEKIVDIKERKKAAVDALLAAVGVGCVTTTNGASSSNKQASNINHLVRKRPKEEVSDGVPNKVPKFEESSSSK